MNNYADQRRPALAFCSSEQRREWTDRDYLVKTVASRTGLSQADAEKRVNDVMTQAKADLDKARKACIHTAIWLTLSLFIGAFAAAAAAWEGGGVRDGTWGNATIQGTVARSR
jgi:hypothetical protein